MSPALAILGVVVIAAGVLGYIAYRNRNNSQAATPLLAAPSGTPTVVAQPEQEPANSPEQASANAVPENTATPAEATAAKKEKTHEKTTAKQQSGAPAARVEVDPEEPPETLDIPNVEPPNVPNRRRGSTVRTEGGVTIRTFADGSQLITSPDGSRILVHPDGRRQVFGPRRPPRRRVPPKY
jgi:hypothetical protein